MGYSSTSFTRRTPVVCDVGIFQPHTDGPQINVYADTRTGSPYGSRHGQVHITSARRPLEIDKERTYSHDRGHEIRPHNRCACVENAELADPADRTLNVDAQRGRRPGSRWNRRR